MDFAGVIERNIQSAVTACHHFLENDVLLEQFETVVKLIVKQYLRGGRLYIAGNGGSAADSQHLAAEFVSKLARDRAPLPAEALTVDSSILTAIGNDYGYEKVFARQLMAKASSKDVFLGLTTSGCSANIIEALKVCRLNKIPSIILSGYQGGHVKDMADHCLIVPGKTTSTIQEMHIILYHSICECVEQSLFSNDEYMQLNSEEMLSE